MTRVLVVGMNPSNEPTRQAHRKNSTFDRLHRWIDELGIAPVSFINVVARPGSVSMQDVQWRELGEAAVRYDRVLALGGFASRVLNRIGVPHHRLPHPSPRNRQFNDPSFEPAMIKEARKYLNGI